MSSLAPPESSRPSAISCRVYPQQVCEIDETAALQEILNMSDNIRTSENNLSTTERQPQYSATGHVPQPSRLERGPTGISMTSVVLKRKDSGVSGIHTAGFKGRIARRLAELDKNGDGLIDAEDLTGALEVLMESERDKGLLKWLLLALAILFVSLIGVTAGLTYGIVQASKDTELKRGVLTDRDTNRAALVGTQQTVGLDWAEMAKAENLQSLLSLSAVTIPGARGSVTMKVLTTARYLDGASTILVLSGNEGELIISVSPSGQVQRAVRNHEGVPPTRGLQSLALSSAAQLSERLAQRRRSMLEDQQTGYETSTDSRGCPFHCTAPAFGGLPVYPPVAATDSTTSGPFGNGGGVDFGACMPGFSPLSCGFGGGTTVVEDQCMFFAPCDAACDAEACPNWCKSSDHPECKGYYGR